MDGVSHAAATAHAKAIASPRESLVVTVHSNEHAEHAAALTFGGIVGTELRGVHGKRATPALRTNRCGRANFGCVEHAAGTRERRRCLRSGPVGDAGAAKQ